MNKLSKPAEDVENDHPTAKNKPNNNAASAESAHKNESTFTGTGEEKAKRHSFSRKLSKEIQAKKNEQLRTAGKKVKAGHGAHESLVVKYLAYRVRTSKKVIDGKRRFYITIRDLHERFPYFGATTIYEIVLRLQTLGYIEIGEFNDHDYDRTFWYHVSEKVCDAAEDDLIYFDAAVADATNVPAAVIFDNVTYRIGKYEKQGRKKQVYVSPAFLTENLPFSESTIKRGLCLLAEKNFTEKLLENEPLYGLAEKNKGSNPNDEGSYPNNRGSYPNRKGSNPNNDTILENVSNPLESLSKEQKPAAFESLNSSCVENKTNGDAHGLSASMSSNPDGQRSEDIKAIPTISPFSQPLAFGSDDGHFADASFVPSTFDISGAAENVKGQWPEVASLEDLHFLNRLIAHDVENLCSEPKSKSRFKDTVFSICSEAISSFTDDELDDLYYSPDGDEIVEAVLPHVQGVIAKMPSLNPSTALFDFIYFGALEAVVGAFMWPQKCSDSYSHPLLPLISVTHDLHLPLWKRAEDRRQKEVEEAFAQMRKDCASPDAHKEHAADLAPAEKMRVFRNALFSKNRVGWNFYDGSYRINQIVVSKRGLKRIQKLFELNDHLTPADLLQIIDRCMKAYSNQPAVRLFKRGVRWHARNGHKLETFASYLKTIENQLGIRSGVEVYLGNEDEEPADEDICEAVAGALAA
jgi:hypothetical protein